MTTDISSPGRIVIVGGGTAGWLSAATFSRTLKMRDVTLVESSDIGIIGVGEGTFPTIRSTLAGLGIAEAEFLRCADATFKQGVLFDGWATGTDSYFHPFNMPIGGEDEALLPHWLLLEGQRPSWADSVTVQERVIRAGRAPKRALDPDFSGPMNYAYHFDAARFADYLQKISISAGVKRIEGTVGKVEQQPDGDIAALTLTDGRRIDGDIFIDCSGFRALLIGQVLGSDFVGCGDTLFNDRALAMQIPYERPDTPIRPYTLATAQAAGWTWDIGLSERRGIGYVYSSRHCSDDEAEAVLRRYVGPQGDRLDPRQLRFATGYRERQWIGNCIAIGLSAGFFEPLESTGIMLIEAALRMVGDFLLPAGYAREAAARRFNLLMAARFDRIIRFLKLHYCITWRTDTAYWRDNADPASIPTDLQDLLAQWRHRPPSRFDFTVDLETFLPPSYHYILYGMGFETRIGAGPARYPGGADARAAFARVAAASGAAVSHLPDHRALLNQLCGRPPFMKVS
jgi:tryptophan halogenase